MKMLHVVNAVPGCQINWEEVRKGRKGRGGVDACACPALDMRYVMFVIQSLELWHINRLKSYRKVS